MKRKIVFVFVGLSLVIFPIIISSPYLSHLAGLILITSLYAMAYNLLFGVLGYVSFGHAGFFGVGSYTVVFFLQGVSSDIFLSIAAGMIFSGVTGVIIGFFCLRNTKIYFAFLTLAFAQAIWAIAFKWISVTNGMSGISVPVGKVVFLPSFDLYNPRVYYYVILFVVVVCVFVLRRIVNSPFGYSLKAIHNNLERAQFVGIQVKEHVFVAIVISAIFSGAAGALQAPLVGRVTPDALYWTNTASALLMTILGGFRYFYGPVVGAFIWMILRELIVTYTIFWQLILGLILALVVLFLPGGILGFLHGKLHHPRS